MHGIHVPLQRCTEWVVGNVSKLFIMSSNLRLPFLNVPDLLLPFRLILFIPPCFAPPQAQAPPGMVLHPEVEDCEMYKVGTRGASAVDTLPVAHCQQAPAGAEWGQVQFNCYTWQV